MSSGNNFSEAMRRFGDNYLGRLRFLFNLAVVDGSVRISPAAMAAGEMLGKSGASVHPPGISIAGRLSLPDDNYFSSGAGSAGFSACLSLQFFLR